MEKLVYNQFCAYLLDNKLLTDANQGLDLYIQLPQLYATVISGTSASTMVSSPQLSFLTWLKLWTQLSIIFYWKILRLLGVDNNSLSWFKSYLPDRHQRCELNGFLSQDKPLSDGLPQGSILGPLLFLIYINDLPTNLTITASCFGNLENMINNE